MMGPALLCTVVLWLFAQHIEATIHNRRSGGIDADQRVTPKSYNVVVLRSIPHVDKPFTQGLEISDDGKTLIETSGSFPEGTQSYIRSINPETGATLWKNTDALGKSFIEGITQLRSNQHWYASLYHSPRKTLEYDANFNFVAEHPYHFDGWGFSRSVDGQSFIATNGSSAVMTLKPDSFEMESYKRIRCGDFFVSGLNELELVDNFMNLGPRLLSNIYCTRFVVVVDPSTMECSGVFDLDDVGEPLGNMESAGYHVANGIAYNKTSDTYFVTGKNWEQMFEVRLEYDMSDSGFKKLQNAMQQDSSRMIFERVGLVSLFQKPTSWLQLSGGRPRMIW